MPQTENARKPNTPEYALALVVMWAKLDFDMPFYHPPLYKQVESVGAELWENIMARYLGRKCGRECLRKNGKTTVLGNKF